MYLDNFGQTRDDVCSNVVLLRLTVGIHRQRRAETKPGPGVRG